MSAEEKKYRIRYLWFRVRTVYNMIRFVTILRENKHESEMLKANDNPLSMEVEEDNEDDEELFCRVKKDTIWFVWFNLMCFVHWLNLLLIPITWHWPELFPSPSKVLWLIELAFLINMVSKGLIKKSRSSAVDSYDIFVEYLKSNFIFDLISTIPNMFSGMNP